MVKENISPEEKLLNIIKQEDNNTIKKREEGVKNSAIFNKINKVAGNVRSLLKEKFSISSGANIKKANSAFFVILLVLIIFLLIDFVNYRPSLKKIYDNVSNLHSAPVEKKLITLLEPFSDYLEICKKRDLFSPSAAKSELIETEVLNLSQLIKDLRLVGIYWGEYPEAMIEHIKEKKTYFVKQGQTIKNIKVKTILEDRVILKYNNEEMELM